MSPAEPVDGEGEHYDPAEEAAFERWLQQVEDDLASITPDEHRAVINKILDGYDICWCDEFNDGGQRWHYSKAHTDE